MSIKLYKFYFEGMEKPITVEAETQADARTLLAINMERTPAYGNKKIINQTVTTPLKGITEMNRGGKLYVWAGAENAIRWVEKS